MTIIRNGHLVSDLFTKPTDKICIYEGTPHIRNPLRKRPHTAWCEGKTYLCWRRQLPTAHREHQVWVETARLWRVFCWRGDEKGWQAAARRFSAVPNYLSTSSPYIFQSASECRGDVLRRQIHTLHRSDEIKQVFPKVPLVAFRRDSNLQDILVNKMLNRQFFNQGNSCGPCGAKRCAVCPYIVAADTFTSAEGVTYKVKRKKQN